MSPVLVFAFTLLGSLNAFSVLSLLILKGIISHYVRKTILSRVRLYRCIISIIFKKLEKSQSSLKITLLLVIANLSIW